MRNPAQYKYVTPRGVLYTNVQLRFLTAAIAHNIFRSPSQSPLYTQELESRCQRATSPWRTAGELELTRHLASRVRCSMMRRKSVLPPYICSGFVSHTPCSQTGYKGSASSRSQEAFVEKKPTEKSLPLWLIFFHVAIAHNIFRSPSQSPLYTQELESRCQRATSPWRTAGELELTRHLASRDRGRTPRSCRTTASTSHLGHHTPRTTELDTSPPEHLHFSPPHKSTQRAERDLLDWDL
ncbi:UNVERIFIED_CONTAM: hypothetical protein FKN15_076313 [Acipenser sinensis]